MQKFSAMFRTKQLQDFMNLIYNKTLKLNSVSTRFYHFAHFKVLFQTCVMYALIDVMPLVQYKFEFEPGPLWK